MSLLDRIMGRRFSAAGLASAARVEPALRAPALAAGPAGDAAPSGSARPSGWLADVGWSGQSRVRTLPRVSPTIAERHATVAAAALSVRGLGSALVLLRGALIRTGIGVLIVGAGELAYQVAQLVDRVGEVGAAIRLLGELATEVWSRMGLAQTSSGVAGRYAKASARSLDRQSQSYQLRGTTT